MTEFKTRVQVRSPIDHVFGYVSDPLNLPRWNSAVRTVRKTSGADRHTGSTYSMQRKLPSGTIEDELEIVATEPPTEFAIRTRSGPTPFVYRYRFSPAEAGTLVELDAEFELRGVPALAGPLAKRAAKTGVEANLATLKSVLEMRSPRCDALGATE